MKQYLIILLFTFYRVHIFNRSNQPFLKGLFMLKDVIAETYT